MYVERIKIMKKDSELKNLERRGKNKKSQVLNQLHSIKAKGKNTNEKCINFKVEYNE